LLYAIIRVWGGFAPENKTALVHMSKGIRGHFDSAEVVILYVFGVVKAVISPRKFCITT